MRYCHRCGWRWVRDEPPGFRDVCPQCRAYLHCCLNCALRDTDHQMCASRTADPIADPSVHNFCEEFRFALRGSRPEQNDALSESSDALRRWKGLFKE